VYDDFSQRSAAACVLFAEDAMDSVIPCAAEEFFRPMLQNRFGNPAKLQFSYRNAQ
jgi:hypothetical protein